jgi:hypothetical protein
MLKSALNIRRLLGDVDVTSIDAIFDPICYGGETVLGYMRRDGIILSENAYPGVEYHEAFHRVSLLLMSDYERTKMYASYRRGTKNQGLSDKVVEEHLADGFMDFMNSRLRKWKWDIQKMFDRLLTFVGFSSRINSEDIRIIYDQIRHGEYRDKEINKESAERFDSVYANEAPAFRLYANDGTTFESDNIMSQKDLSEIVNQLESIVNAKSGIITADDILSKGTATLKALRNSLMSAANNGKFNEKAAAIVNEITSDELWPVIENEYAASIENKGFPLGRIHQNVNEDGDAEGAETVDDNLGIENIDDNEDDSGAADIGEQSDILLHTRQSYEISPKKSVLFEVRYALSNMPKWQWDNGVERRVAGRLLPFPLSYSFSEAWPMLLNNLGGVRNRQEMYDTINYLASQKNGATSDFFLSLSKFLFGNNQDGTLVIDDSLLTKMIVELQSKHHHRYINFSIYTSKDKSYNNTYSYAFIDKGERAKYNFYAKQWGNAIASRENLLNFGNPSDLFIDKINKKIDKYNKILDKLRTELTNKNIGLKIPKPVFSSNGDVYEFVTTLSRDLSSLLSHSGNAIPANVITTALRLADNDVNKAIFLFLGGDGGLVKGLEYIRNVAVAAKSKVKDNIGPSSVFIDKQDEVKNYYEIQLNDIFKKNPYNKFFQNLARYQIESDNDISPEGRLRTADGKFVYPWANGTFITDLVKELNHRSADSDVRNDTVSRLSRNPYTQGSIVLDYLTDNNDVDIFTFLDSFDKSKNETASYQKMSNRNRALMQQEAIRGDKDYVFFPFPIMAEKITYPMLRLSRAALKRLNGWIGGVQPGLERDTHKLISVDTIDGKQRLSVNSTYTSIIQNYFLADIDAALKFWQLPDNNGENYGYWYDAVNNGAERYKGFFDKALGGKLRQFGTYGNINKDIDELIGDTPIDQLSEDTVTRIIEVLEYLRYTVEEDSGISENIILDNLARDINALVESNIVEVDEGVFGKIKDEQSFLKRVTPHHLKNVRLNKNVFASRIAKQKEFNAKMNDELADTLAVLDMLVESSVGMIVGHMEFQKVFMADPAFAKNHEDAVKRYSGMLSNGTTHRVEETDQENYPLHYNSVTLDDNTCRISPQLTELRRDLYEPAIRQRLIDTYTEETGIAEDDISDDVMTSINEEAANIAETDTKGFLDIDANDGYAVVSKSMFRQILKGQGRLTPDIDEALEILDDPEALSDPEKAKAIYRVIINPLKMASFEHSGLNGNGDITRSIQRPLYDKFALFPLTKATARGDNYALLEWMEEHNVGMAKFDSTVKLGLGSTGSIYRREYTNGKLNKDATHENAQSGEGLMQHLSEVRITRQDFAKLRHQLPTDPHKEKTHMLGTQFVKLAISNLENGKSYGNPAAGMSKLPKEQIITRVHSAIKKLADIGTAEVLERIGVQRDINGEISFDEDKYKSSKFRLLGDKASVAHKQAMAEDTHIPLSSLPNKADAESKVLALINKLVTKIELPGGMSVQQSEFGVKASRERMVEYLESDEFKSYGYQLNNGNKLRFISKNKDGEIDGSVEIIPSVRSFALILEKHFGRGWETLPFLEVRQYLFDKGVIGVHSKPCFIGYRIPTQSLNSIFAFKVADVLPQNVGDDVIVPAEFTKLTGSNFEIDKLSLHSFNYSVGKRDGNIKRIDFSDILMKDGTILDETTYLQNELLTKEEYGNGDIRRLRRRYKQKVQNMLLDTYMHTLTDNMLAYQTRKPLDNSTKPLSSEDEGSLRNIVLAANENTVDALPLENMSLRKNMRTANDYVSGKDGVGPVALQNQHHALTQAVPFGAINSNLAVSINAIVLNGNKNIPAMDADRYSKFEPSKSMNIIDIISAGISAFVDIAKDPYIIKYNINGFTYNVLGLLLRAGHAYRSFAWLATPSLQELARANNSENSRYDKYIGTQRVLFKYINKLNKLAKIAGRDINQHLMYYDIDTSRGRPAVSIDKNILSAQYVDGSKIKLWDYIINTLLKSKNDVLRLENVLDNQNSTNVQRTNAANELIDYYAAQLDAITMFYAIQPMSDELANIIHASTDSIKNASNMSLLYMQSANVALAQTGSANFDEVVVRNLLNTTFVNNKQENKLDAAETALAIESITAFTWFKHTLYRFRCYMNNKNLNSYEIKQLSGAIEETVMSKFLDDPNNKWAYPDGLTADTDTDAVNKRLVGEIYNMFYGYQKIDDNASPLEQLKQSHNLSIARQLSLIQSLISNNTVTTDEGNEFNQFGVAGRVTNPLLVRLNSILNKRSTNERMLPDSIGFHGDAINTDAFIRDNVIDSLDELLALRYTEENSISREIGFFAERLCKFALVQRFDRQVAGNILNIVPLSFRREIGWVDFCRELLIKSVDISFDTFDNNSNSPYAISDAVVSMTAYNEDFIVPVIDLANHRVRAYSSKGSRVPVIVYDASRLPSVKDGNFKHIYPPLTKVRMGNGEHVETYTYRFAGTYAAAKKGSTNAFGITNKFNGDNTEYYPIYTLVQKYGVNEEERCVISTRTHLMLDAANEGNPVDISNNRDVKYLIDCFFSNNMGGLAEIDSLQGILKHCENISKCVEDKDSAYNYNMADNLSVMCLYNVVKRERMTDTISEVIKHVCR